MIGSRLCSSTAKVAGQVATIQATQAQILVKLTDVSHDDVMRQLAAEQRKNCYAAVEQLYENTHSPSDDKA